MAQRKHEPGPPMDLAHMRRQGVRRLIAYCLNDACRHQAFIEVWSYRGDGPSLVPIALGVWGRRSGRPSIISGEARRTPIYLAI